jgi:hypothetical protein
MAGLKPAVQDILTQLTGLQDGNGNPLLATVNIWNNHLKYEQEGKLYDFAKPAAFLEIVNKVDYKQLGQAVQQSDVGFSIHLIHEFYDDQLGNFEQNLGVFDVRDGIVDGLSYFLPTGCNEMIRVGEDYDHDHDQEFHFVIHFVTCLIDTTVFNNQQKKFTLSTPADITIVNSIIQRDFTNDFNTDFGT